MNKRVLTILKPLVASKGFGEKTLQGLATNLSTGLTDESTDEEITTAIEGFMPMIDLMQSENTRYVNEYKKNNPAQTPPAPAKVDPNTPAPAPTGVEAQLLELTDKFNKLMEQNNALSLSQKWAKLAEANGFTNETLIEKWQPKSEDDFDSAMESLKEFSKEFVKKSANDRSPGKPNSGERNDPDPKKPKELTAAGKQALEGLKKANERHAKKAQ